MSHDYGSKSGKERVREYKAMESILRGETPEKRILVGYEGKKQKHGDIESPLTEIMQKVRMPWFCPSCKKVMKKKMDNQTWMQFEHCFDCQIEFENKLIIEGKYDDWRKKKSVENRLAKYKDDLQGLKEFYDKKNVTHFNAINPELGALDTETYEVENPEEWDKKIDEAVEFFENEIVKLEKELEELNEVA
tara:strand:+ start:1083 stop:1655 length:573 start_codon:yes stop_codon:yes gene_type:complete